MKTKIFNELVNGTMTKMKDLLFRKGHDYTAGSDDRLLNFKKSGAALAEGMHHVVAYIVSSIESDKTPNDACTLIAGKDITLVRIHPEKAAKMGALQTWFIYFSKHCDAIRTYVTTGKVESEGIQERFIDIANYAILGLGLAVEFGDAEIPLAVSIADELFTAHQKNRDIEAFIKRAEVIARDSPTEMDRKYATIILETMGYLRGIDKAPL